MSTVSVAPLDDGACWRVQFGGGKGNVLDAATMQALTQVFRDAAGTSALKAICLEGVGPHFSFGASVEEHLPEQVGTMLSTFHGLLLALLDSAVVVVAGVRGQCLGGALELVTVCHRVAASQDARLGQPEIKLGVFAPFASLMLRERIGRVHAEDLCLSGRSVDAAEALRMGLVDEVTSGDPAEAGVAWVRKHLMPLSASSLRLAVRALRLDVVARLRHELPAVEALYLHGLMHTADAVEGLKAFLDKRPPRWRNA